MMKVSAAIYVVVCSVMWLLPLFRLLHVESSAVIAFVSFFVAGLSSLHFFAKGASIFNVMIRHLLLLLVPLVMLTVSLIWQPNCEYGQGFLFFLLFPCITVLFSVSLAFAIQRFSLKRPRLLLVSLGIFISLAGPIFDIGFHSQFFTYNHIFGGVMGPIYDEEITIRRGLVIFRGLTLLWTALFLFWGVSGKKATLLSKVSRAGVLLGIGTIYLSTAPLQINSPAWFIQKELGGHLATEHFDIYFDPEKTSPYQIYQYKIDHEFRYAHFKEQLGIDVKQRIKSFIYPDPGAKERFTGARFTNVAPVWLQTPQLHISAAAFENVFAHELLHVFSREFGLPIINASVSVGLVEGLAVAMEPSEGRPSPHDQVITASILNEQNTLSSGATLGRRVEASLSPFGFWTGRGAVSYTTMGSFVRFLIDRYGVERMKDVYAYSNFQKVYGKSTRELTEEWEAYLSGLPAVPRVTHDYVTRRFSVPSLFERRCPHHIPPAVVKHRESIAALVASDTSKALINLEESLNKEPMYQPAIETWAQIQLGEGRPDSVIARVERLFSGESESFRTPLMWMLLGDAHSLIGNTEIALGTYQKAQAGLPLYAHDQIGFLELRKTLVDYPDLLSVILAPLSYTDKVENMKAIPEGESIGLFLEAILLSNASMQGEARDALQLLDITTIPQDRIDFTLVDRYYRMKKTQVYFLTGEITQALTEATLLEEELTRIGALREAAFYTDFANKMRYIDRAL